MGFHQEPNEPLHDYLYWFNYESLLVKRLNQDVALHMLMHGLRPRAFAKSWAKREPELLEELQQRAECYLPKVLLIFFN